MKKIFAFFVVLMAVTACSKHDPILPGTRVDIFDTTETVVENKEIPTLSQNAKEIYGDKDCEYTQDALNNIWNGDKKIYAGFVMDSVVKSNQSPICSGQFIYTGLSTGEVIKINTKTRKVVWTTDVYRTNNLTGGATVVDIIAHVGLDGKFVFAGGLGDAFCKLNANNGNKIWCVNISVPVDFIIVDNFAFVVGTDNNLYALNTDNGAVYWKSQIKKQVSPKYDGKTITVGKERFDYKNGTIAK